MAVLAFATAACSAENGTTPGNPGTAAVSTARLNPASSELGLGSTLQLKLTALDADDNEVAGRGTVWSSQDTLVATVSQSGLVTARRIGVVQLQAVVEGRSALSVINVVAARVARVAISPTSPSVAAGGSLQLTATATDAAGAELPDRLKFWESSNNAVALVTSTGLVSGRTAGTATVTATSEGKSASVQVTVTGVTPPPPTGGGTTPAAVDSVKVDPADTTMVRNTTARFRVRVFAGAQAVSGRTVVWSITKSSGAPDVLTVTPSGDVTALDRPNSTGFVNATVEGKAGSAQVKVTNKAANRVTVTAERPSLQVGESMTVNAAVFDVDNVALTGSTASWRSSDAAVLTVTSTGPTTARVTAEGVGSTTVTATADGVSGGVSIAVTAPPAPAPLPTASVSVTPATASLLPGQEQQLTATAFNKDEVRREGRTFTWQSNAPGVATVDRNGLVLAAGAAGTATITAADGSVTGSAAITVTVPPPPPATTRVAVSPPPGGLLPGQTAQLTATAFDGATPRAGRTFVWSSSNTAVATVNAAGLVTATGPGTATISAADGTVVGSTTVTVGQPPPAPVDRVGVTPAASTLEITRTQQLSATPRDAAGNALTGRPAASWASSNAAVATVSPGGLVTAVAAGTVTITASIEGKSGTATVTVNAPPPPPVVTARVEVAPPTATIAVGATRQLTATAFDRSGAPRAGRSFRWTSSAPTIATVSAAGVVTAVRAGTATITATADSVSGTSAITVTAPPITPASVEPANLTVLDQGSAARRDAVVNARTFRANSIELSGRQRAGEGDHTLVTITQTSPAVARIRGMEPGSTVVTATCEEGVTGNASVSVCSGDDDGDGGSNNA